MTEYQKYVKYKTALIKEAKINTSAAEHILKKFRVWDESTYTLRELESFINDLNYNKNYFINTIRTIEVIKNNLKQKEDGNGNTNTGERF